MGFNRKTSVPDARNGVVRELPTRLPEVPAEVTKRFPSMVEWQKKQQQAVEDLVEALAWSPSGAGDSDVGTDGTDGTAGGDGKDGLPGAPGLTTIVQIPAIVDITGFGLQRLVFIAARTDGKPGLGILNDPFDGSTASKLDVLLASLPEFTEIVLLPGVFQTRGYHNNNAPAGGWQLKPGWKLRGCGIGVTTVKLVEATAGDHAYIVLCGTWKGETITQCRNFLEVSDLTIDCNGPENYPAPGTTGGTLHGIHVQGSHVRLSRLRVINWMSKQNAGEAFGIAADGPTASIDPHQTLVANFIIEDCIVEQPYWVDTSGATCIQLGGGELSDGSQRFGYYGTIKGCVIDGRFLSGQEIAYPLPGGGVFTAGRRPFNGLGFGSGYGFTYENNRISNINSAGPYLDSYSIRENICRNNIYHNVWSGPTYAMGGGTTRQMVTSITRTGSVATVTTDSKNMLFPGNRLTISGTGIAEYDLANVVTGVVSPFQFTMTVAGTPANFAWASPNLSTRASIQTQHRHERVVVENNDLSLARVLDYSGSFRSSGILFSTGTADPPDGEYLLREAIVRGNRISLVDGDMNTGNETGAAIEIADCERLVLEDNVCNLPRSVGPGFGYDTPATNPKAHIYLWNIGTLVSRNNRRAADLSFVLPLVSYGIHVGLSIVAITRAGVLATVTLAAANYLLAAGEYVTVNGATGGDAPLYNIMTQITSVLSSTVFTYTMAGTPGGSAAGTLTMAHHKFASDLDYEQQKGALYNLCKF